MSYQFPALTVPVELPMATADDPQIALRRTLRISLIVVGVFVFGLIAMASFIQTRGAAIGSGRVSVESSVKRIAHPTGGVIAQVFVKEGDRVRKGDPILRFDDTVSGGNAATLGQSLEQLLASQARLIAERDGQSDIRFPAQLTEKPTPSALAAMEEARRQFAVRRQLRGAEQAAYRERIHQAQQEIAATGAQRSAAGKQAALVRPELKAMRELYDRRLVTMNRLNQTERTAVELEGSVATYGANIAQTRARIAEIQQSAVEAEQAARNQAAQELANVTAQLGDQRIRSLATSDAADRSLIRAPYAGVVERLDGVSVGAVVAPTKTVAEIVPDTEPLIVDVNVRPDDIDQIHKGQPAIVNFTALNRQSTPELHGEVYYVAMEPTVDERTGASFFSVRVKVSDAEMRKLGKAKLKSGMPAETFFQTSRRSLLSYLLKPLADQFNRAFRE